MSNTALIIQHMPNQSAIKAEMYWSAKEVVTAYREHSRTPPAPKAPGVYAFWDGNRCMYVGESRDLKSRLSGHERRTELSNCEIRWLACKNHKQAETWLIEQFGPICNGITQRRKLWMQSQIRKHSMIPLDTRWNETWKQLFGETFEEFICKPKSHERNAIRF